MTFGNKEVKLKDGTPVILRPMRREDEEALYRFFLNLPDQRVRIARYDVRDREIIHHWATNIDYNITFPLLALVGEEVVGDVTFHRVSQGWKRHIGEVRIMVSSLYQNKGLGTLMLNELVGMAAEFALEKLWVEVPLDSVEAIRAFRNAGFTCKAVIEGLVKDSQNRNVDILIMICDVATYFDRRWAERERCFHSPGKTFPEPKS